LNTIDFALEANLKFWPVYMKSMLCSSSTHLLFYTCWGDWDRLSWLLT